MVDSQAPPPMLWTPKVLPRKSSSDSMPFLTMSSRGSLLFPAAKQPSFMPATEELTALLGAAQTRAAAPVASVVIMICPVRVCKTAISTPCL